MKIQVAVTKVMLSWVLWHGIAAARDPQSALSFPAGTAVPITFLHTLDSAKLKIGDRVIAKTDQVILGSGGERIRSGSELVGRVVEVQPSGSSTNPAILGIRFETLRVRDHDYSIRVALRALACFVDSYSIHSPAIDNGYQENSVYRQVGGDYFYQGDVVYSNDWEEVGKSTRAGVFVKLQQIEQPKSQNHFVCESTDTLQSVGVFASNACGIYGFLDLTVDDAGAESSGVIRFLSTKHTVKIASGATALLQVIASPE